MIILQAQGAGFNPMIFLLIMGIFLVVNYVIIIPKQKKKEKEQVQFVEALGNGAKIVTASGIHGKLIRFEDTNMILEIATGVQIRMEKNYINFEMTKKLNTIA